MFLDPTNSFFVERGTTDLDARRRAKPIENPLPRPAIATPGMDKRRCFIPALITGKPQSWQSYLRLAERPDFFDGFEAGFFFAAGLLFGGAGFAVARAGAGLADARTEAAATVGRPSAGAL